MKTAPSNSKKTALRLSVVLAFGAILLFMARCQKEETFAPTNKNSTENTIGKPDPGLPIESPMIIIEHRGNGKWMPEYNVLVMPSGIAYFNGWRNTYFIGHQKFEINSKLLVRLNNMFIESGLFNIYPKASDVPDNGGITAAITTDVLAMEPALRPAPVPFLKPAVYTSYRVGPEHLLITLKDNYTRPIDLIKLRTDAEKFMGISKYVNGEP